MIKKLLFSLALAAAITSNSKAYIVSLATYSKVMPDGHTQCIHLLGDRHESNIQADQQRLDFLTTLTNSNGDDTLVITEDTEGHPLKIQFLQGLTLLCQLSGIPAINLEFRQNINKDYDTTLDDFFIKHLDPAIAEITEYKDGDILAKYYRDVLIRRRMHGAYQVDCYREHPGARQQTLRTLYRDHVETIVISNLTELLDARIVHTIYNQPNKKHIFICAGCVHTYHLELILQDLGYAQTMHTNPLKKFALEQVRDTLCVPDSFNKDSQDIQKYFAPIFRTCKREQDMPQCAQM